MKYIILLMTLVWCSALLLAQQTVTPGQINQAIATSQSPSTQTGKNYIRTYTYRNGTTPSDGNVNDVNIDIQYFDGLGHPTEVVSLKASPTGNDMVALQTYDKFGRTDSSFIPYASSTTGGIYVAKTSVISALPTFVTANYEVVGTDASYGYSQPIYEKAPMNRVLQKGAPGAEWQPNTHAEQYAYQTNTAAISSYKYSGDTYSTISYDIGKLYVTLSTDGDSKQTRTYTDYLGKVVMKESFDGNNWLQTRYCYDDFDLLRCVLQPYATTPAQTEYCFYYTYDSRHRMTGKKIPGCEWIYMIYDARDRLVLTSDSVSRAADVTYDKYYYTIYDDYNRPIEKGNVLSSATYKTKDQLVSFYSTSTARFRTATDYNFTEKLVYDTHSGIYATCPFAVISGLVAATDTAANSKGFLTGRITKTYYSTSYVPTNTKTETYYYDKFGRLLQTVTNNFTSGTDRITNVYNFAGQIVQARNNHNAFTVSYTLDMYYSYDHRGRLLNTEYAVAGYNGSGLARTIVSANVYNEAGMLKTKYQHSVTLTGLAFMQKIDYKYNIRGWLTGINDPGLSTASTDGDKFGMKLGYNRQPDGTTNGLWNGNISGMKWGTPNYQNLQYLFTYDPVNRLTAGTFNGTGFTSPAYNTSYVYNKNGNITTLTRYGSTGVNTDAMSYYYNTNSNQLNSTYDSKGDVAGVEDFSGSLTGTGHYGYDYNGNLTRDDYKSMAITYNDLNLPVLLDFGSNNRINYFYNATGEKMLRSVSVGGATPTLTYYMGPFVHEGLQGGTSSLKYIITPEGRMVNSGTDISPSWSWEYNLTDHLGNVRAVIAPTTTAGYSTLLQQTHYYPFGMRMSQISTSASSTNDYLYNGKQLQSNFNLNWYDYGARFYDPAIGRFTSVDPLVEKYPGLSPYAYCANNPIRFIDPTGMELVDTPFGKMEGKLIYSEGEWGTEPPKPNKVPLMLDQSLLTGNKKSTQKTEEVNSEDPQSSEAGSSPSLNDLKKSPPDHPEYESPKGGDRWVRNPNGRGAGWIDKKGRVWVPETHKGNEAPHWDRQEPKGGGYTKIYPYLQPAIDPSMRARIGEIVGLSGTALTIYLIISEGSRLFPPRNLIPVP